MPCSLSRQNKPDSNGPVPRGQALLDVLQLVIGAIRKVVPGQPYHRQGTQCPGYQAPGELSCPCPSPAAEDLPASQKASLMFDRLAVPPENSFVIMTNDRPGRVVPPCLSLRLANRASI